MPRSLRHRHEPPPPPSPEEPFSESEDEYGEATFEEGEDLEQDAPDLDEGEDDEGEDDEALDPSAFPASAAIPPHFRDISTLASWTASSSKPGCSIPQLRHPSTSLFWQSDGPQPHYLNIHFFKLVRIVGLRLYLDFEADESYTPTRIVLLAGSGMNDLVEWGEMRLESPKGWVWADFEGVGEADSDESDDGEDDDDEVPIGRIFRGAQANLGLPLPPPNPANDTSDSENAAPRDPVPPPPPPADPRPAEPDAMVLDAPNAQQLPQVPHFPRPDFGTPTLPRPQPRHPFTPLPANLSPNPRSTRTRTPKMPVLRCHLVQIKILENHQNGKDTHLRGLQIFARNNEKEAKKSIVSVGAGRKSEVGSSALARTGKKKIGGLSRSDWMGEMSIR